MRYARYADAGYDADGLASLFAPDAVWDGGSLFGRAEGTEAIHAQFVGAPTIPWALHYVLAPQLEVDDDGRPRPPARGTCGSPAPGGDGPERAGFQAWLAGTYDDTYVKVDGRWLFQTVEVPGALAAGPAVHAAAGVRRPRP